MKDKWLKKYAKNADYLVEKIIKKLPAGYLVCTAFGARSRLRSITASICQGAGTKNVVKRFRSRDRHNESQVQSIKKPVTVGSFVYATNQLMPES